MIVVRVELHAFSTREVTELARMHICNIGGTRTLGNYTVETFRGRSKADLDRMIPQRNGSVWRHPRLNDHVWKLVAKALASVDYVRPRPEEAPDQPAAVISLDAVRTARYLEDALRGFLSDPADSDFQRGYLAALLTIYTEALGKGVGDDRLTLLHLQTDEAGGGHD